MEKRTPHCKLAVVKAMVAKGAIAMKCPSCGERKLVRDTRDIPYTYKGESTTIPAVRGEFCPACGESVLAAAESKRVSAAMLAFNKQVNASIVDRKSTRLNSSHLGISYAVFCLK